MEPTVPPAWDTDPEQPVVGWGPVEVPPEQLWQTFVDVPGWKRWNPCIAAARITGGELRPGARLIWVFRPIKRRYLYRMPAVATITEVMPGERVTWEVRLPGFHAFHSYLFDTSADGVTARFGSWEIAEGPMYRLLRRFWLAHFRFVRDESIAGAATLATRTVRLVASGPEPTADLPPIVVIPGIDGQRGSVAPIVDRLAQYRRVLLVDYSHETNPTLDDLADEIVGLLPDRCDLVGQSVGTWLAALVAQSRADAVRRVALIATFTRVRDTALRVSAWTTRWAPGPLYRLATPTLMKIACGPIGDGRDHPFLRDVADSDQEGVARRTRWQIGRDFGPMLRGISQPVAVFVGQRDRFVPDRDDEFDRIRAVFDRPGGSVTVIEDAGHVMLPSPAINQVTTAILEHLS